MAAKDHLSHDQMHLFTDEGDQASSRMRMNDVMAWVRDKEKGKGVSQWYPGWAVDNGYTI
jgi:hypothetical protein